jgi:L-aminopeptidase/D-esterase-like protein
MLRPGPRNLITDVAGLSVGQAEDHAIRTGVTVLLADSSANAAVDIRGGAPGTRETDALDPVNVVGQVDAIVLSGGSAFGLEAASGVAAFLRANGRGYELAPGVPRVPIVPAAILFDLVNGGNKEWGEEPPYRALGRKAMAAASADFHLGNAGAGLGATAGIYKGGLGSASIALEDGVTVGAIAAANPLGSPLIPGTNIFWAWPLEQNKEFGGRTPQGPLAPVDLDLPSDMRGARARAHTTIAIVATDAEISRIDLKRIAIMAADGFARALRPVHTPFDGDVVFALATGKKKLAEPGPRAIMRLGSLAADCLARAIARGVYEAQSLGALKSYRETFP